MKNRLWGLISKHIINKKLLREKFFVVFVVFQWTIKFFILFFRRFVVKMALLEYFHKEACGPWLLDLCGPISQEIGTKFTEEANKVISSLSTRLCHWHESYLKLTPEQKAIVAKFTAMHGVIKVIRQFLKEFDSTFIQRALT